MNRRIFFWILALALLLSACGPSQPVPVESTVPSESAAPSESPVPAESTIPVGSSVPRTEAPQGDGSPEDLGPRSEGSPEDLGPGSNDAPEIPPTESPDTPENLPADAGPAPAETGETEPPGPPTVYRVVTDDSHYTPYQPPASLYTKAESGDFSEFHPREDLGAIYPYAAKKLYSSYGNGFDFLGGYLYGFVSRDGEILTDGVYTSVRPMTIYDYSGYVQEILHQAPLWLTQRVGEVTLRHYSTEYGDYTYPEGEVLYGVAAIDGSFALPCEYRSIQLLSEGDRFVCYRSWDRPDFEIRDLQGGILLTSRDLIPGDAAPDQVQVTYREGLYYVELEYFNEEGVYVSGQNECWFADEQGKRVFGPYRAGSAFSDGVACVSEDGKTYGYIGKNGAWVIQPRYTICSDFENGRAVQSTGGSKRSVIDKSGRELFSCSGGFLSACPCGFVFHITTNTSYTSKSTFCDRDGSVLFTDKGYWTCQTADFFTLYDNERVTLRSLRPGAEDTVISHVRNFYDAAALIDGKAVRGLCCERGIYGDIFITPDGNAIYSEDDGTVELRLEEYTYYTFDEITGEGYWIFGNGGRWEAFGENGASIGTCGSIPRIIDGRLFETGEFACTFKDCSGTLLFSFPLQSDD